jgi:hypothetical protein
VGADSLPTRRRAGVDAAALRLLGRVDDRRPWSVARPLIAGLKNPVVVHDDRLSPVVPVDPTPFDETARRALTDHESAGVRP